MPSTSRGAVVIGTPSNIAYLRIRANQVSARNIKTGEEATLKSPQPFTTTRLLVGELGIAGRLVSESLKAVFPRAFWSTAPAVVIHPLEVVEGGLSEIEQRLFRELVLGAGAAWAIVVTGSELSDAEVRAAVSRK